MPEVRPEVLLEVEPEVQPEVQPEVPEVEPEVVSGSETGRSTGNTKCKTRNRQLIILDPKTKYGEKQHHKICSLDWDKVINLFPIFSVYAGTK